MPGLGAGIAIGFVIAVVVIGVIGGFIYFKFIKKEGFTNLDDKAKYKYKHKSLYYKTST